LPGKTQHQCKGYLFTGPCVKSQEKSAVSDLYFISY
jgi:hypothetical protein